jgi:nucleoside-diphosphate-sugar epimerase
VPELRTGGHDVIAIDVRPPAALMDGVESRVVDLSDYRAVDAALADVEAVIHLAALAWFQDQPHLQAGGLVRNATSAANVFEVIVARQIKRVVYASSINAYGVVCPYWPEDRRFVAPEYLPIDEDHPCKPILPYGISKLLGEQLAESMAHRVAGSHVVSLRYPGIRPVGPRRKGSDDDALHHLVSGLSATVSHHEAARATRLALENAPLGYHAINIGAAPSRDAWSPAMVERAWGKPIPMKRPLGNTDPLYAVDRAREMIGFVCQDE